MTQISRISLLNCKFNDEKFRCPYLKFLVIKRDIFCMFFRTMIRLIIQHTFTHHHDFFPFSYLI